jgi:hypothetical protein
MSQAITDARQHLIERLRAEEASEDTEHVIDWLEDSWATFDMLKERFGETRAWQLYTAGPLSASKQRAGKNGLEGAFVPLCGRL